MMAAEYQELSALNAEASNELADGDPGVDDADDTDKEIDGGKQWVLNPEPKRRKTSDRKQAEHEAFDLWIEENQEALAGSVSKFVVDGDDFRTLMRDFKNERIIANPRDYQLELFELAKKQNTIAVLDTGSGKTLIAALLLRWTIQNELVDRSQGLSKRISFFLVDKVALVFQQHAVLERNLDFPVEKLCGDDMIENEPKEFWNTTIENNMAIVCTAEVLNQGLHRSYIRMDQINLLVFDEAHHTKKNHPYARIIKDFYAEMDDSKPRPRIFGMTASPVDAHIDPKVAIAELEALLHSRIATIADPAVLQHSSARLKNELSVEYPKKKKDWDTDLNGALKKLVGDNSLLRKCFAFTSTAAAELGPWCADRYWQLIFGDGNTGFTLESKTERELLRVADYLNGVGVHVDKVREARKLVEEHDFGRPRLSEDFLSPKVICLYKILRDQFKGVNQNRRCIVFVRQRNVASLLVDLLEQPEMRIPGLEPAVLVGGGRTESSWDSARVSYRDQVRTLVRFKNGDINCLFATSVAEEGLDVPDCNVIIRFDLSNTLIQYIQSRGRARQEDSVYIHMLERGNYEHREKVAHMKQNEDALRKFLECLPEDRKLTGNTFNMDYFLRKERKQRQYTVPETGAKLNYKQSLVYLAAFVASLPHPPEAVLTANYVVVAMPGGFQCEVILPDSSPIRSATGRVHASKAVAKCSAAYEMCLQLVKNKYLDEHLRPVFTKQLPAMRNARLALSSKKQTQYDMRIKPEIWSRLGEPTELYVTVLTLASPAALGYPSTPLLLLAREPVHEIAPFPLFFGNDRSSPAACIPVRGCLSVDETQLQGLTAFTLTVFKDVFSKEYEATAAQLPYFLAPTRLDHTYDFKSLSDPSAVIDWATVHFVQQNERFEYHLDELPDDDFFRDKFVADPYDGARKFFLKRRRDDMKPTDLVPEGVVAPSHRAWSMAGNERSVLNWSFASWSKSSTYRTLQQDQPVFEAELLPVRRNFLDDEPGARPFAPETCFIVLEPMRISPLPVNVVTMIYTLPSILHRLEASLIAVDACKKVGLSEIRADLALEAFTKDSDDADEAQERDAEKATVKAGMGNNYERLEFLGDCFLKMATTISVVTLIPEKAELDYHVERMLMVCNRNLFNNALELHLEEYIRSMAFDRRSWYPQGLTLKRGKRKGISARKHVLADKSIADVCEALIGAAYLTGRDRSSDPTTRFDLAIRAVTHLVPWATAPATPPQLDMANRFAARLGYRFRHPRLLRSAFQHPTYPTMYERLPSYQRLEFLGDALLDMACVEFLFDTYPGADPKWLTEHKMAMVSNQFLGCLAVYLGFHRAMQYVSPQLQRQIADYAAEMEDALQVAREEAGRKGSTDPEKDFARDFWVVLSQPPKCLPDVVEAYIGAVFVDSGYEFGPVREFFEGYVLPFFGDPRLYDEFVRGQAVTALMEAVQKRSRCGECRVLVRELPAVAEVAVPAEGEGQGDGTAARQNRDDAAKTKQKTAPVTLHAGVGPGVGAAKKQVVCAVRIHGVTVAHAVAGNGWQGKIVAARKAKEVLEGLKEDEFRKRFRCDCGRKKEQGEVEGVGGEGGREEVNG
ncbi:hypothetical protein VTJ49DRAFT_202 [Mycothermus thermophilus]|uniref:Dicer-like protein 1 n=1 Tax=Humicola insolens TaxID=85995 RepID=A0ABR3VGR2_HUMIN